PGRAGAAIGDGIDGEVALLGDIVQFQTRTGRAWLDEIHDFVAGEPGRQLRVDRLQEVIDVRLAVVEQPDDALCAVAAPGGFTRTSCSAVGTRMSWGAWFMRLTCLPSSMSNFGGCYTSGA